MPDPQQMSGLVACDECGAPHPARQIESEADSTTTATCPECGNDSFTQLMDPSGG